ncbi:MAG TPA: non-homologous end-joining DNA ligase [Pyrinomonadaceae bacterium]|nr:non-homologous end-joining DNA ligase [Pyrinomonadaceae bacterium]
MKRANTRNLNGNDTKMGLETYRKKRDFKKTPEPKGKISKADKHRFVCQEHHASNLHFDFRLEVGGVLKSWSLRKGPSMDPDVKRLAVPTEDHPVEYLKFQGDIPEGNYGAGEHRIWDEGSYKLLDGDDAEQQFEKGKFKFDLDGEKLKGSFNLFRLGDREQWLMVKSRDKYADPDWKLRLLIPDDEGHQFIEDDSKTALRGNGKPAKISKKNDEVKKITAKLNKGERLPSLSSVLDKKHPEGDVRVKIGSYAVDLTSLDRVYWPDDGYTKADLIDYYYQVAEFILPYLKNRPLIMKRYPTGINGQSFHQHDVDEVPEYVRTVKLEAQDQGPHSVNYVICDNIQTHLYLANLGAIERHPWHSRIDTLESPDWFVFDLDPGEEVEFETICDVAMIAHDIIDGLGLESYVKTSGSRGIHVYVPIKPKYDYDRVAKLAEQIAKMVAAEAPKTATVERSKTKRKKDQIYVDHLQNAYGKSVVAPYSARPRPGATVSAPVEWTEVKLKRISTADFTIKNMLGRLKKKGDLFAPVLTNKQDLKQAFEKLRAK